MESPKVSKTFIYRYIDYDGNDESITYPVEFPLQLETINELSHRIVTNEMHSTLAFCDLQPSIQEELNNFVESQRQQQCCDDDDSLILAVQTGTFNTNDLVNECDNKHKDEILEYTTKTGPTDEEIFAQSFHRLVHSALLMEILMKEQSYAKSIIELNNQHDEQVELLTNRHRTEMDAKINQLDDGTTSDDINNLISIHYSIQNSMQRKWESELDAKMGHQKNDFRNWIVGLLSQMIYSLDERSSIASSSSNHNDSDSSSKFQDQMPTFEESFTIYLGSQLKHMHNMRLIASNIYDLCDALDLSESIRGANISLGLYSSSLTGIVLLTPSGLVKANATLIKKASMSTEFHFDQIHQQIDDIQNELKTKTGSKLKVGDFFITRHSNLSQTQIVFHLISDEASDSPEDITSRHPVILGLRNILKTASRYDVTNLSIPALLRHEMSEDMTVQWCNRRADLVFKCAKGFIIESASWGGSELNTLQLILPKDISYELFSSLANTIPQVFRLANAKIFTTRHH